MKRISTLSIFIFLLLTYINLYAISRTKPDYEVRSMSAKQVIAWDKDNIETIIKEIKNIVSEIHDSKFTIEVSRPRNDFTKEEKPKRIEESEIINPESLFNNLVCGLKGADDAECFIDFKLVGGKKIIHLVISVNLEDNFFVSVRREDIFLKK